jgi:hypothetical protein
MKSLYEEMDKLERLLNGYEKPEYVNSWVKSVHKLPEI